jgi:hypothetical protein
MTYEIYRSDNTYFDVFEQADMVGGEIINLDNLSQLSDISDDTELFDFTSSHKEPKLSETSDSAVLSEMSDSVVLSELSDSFGSPGSVDSPENLDVLNTPDSPSTLNENNGTTNDSMLIGEALPNAPRIIDTKVSTKHLDSKTADKIRNIPNTPDSEDEITETTVPIEDIYVNLKKQLESLGFKFNDHLSSQTYENTTVLNYTDFKYDINIDTKREKKYIFVGDIGLSADIELLLILNYVNNNKNKIQVIWKEGGVYTAAYINYKKGTVKISFDFDLDFNLVTEPVGTVILQKDGIKVWLENENSISAIYVQFEELYIKSLIDSYKTFNDGDVKIRTLNGMRVYLPASGNKGYFNTKIMEKL